LVWHRIAPVLVLCEPDSDRPPGKTAGCSVDVLQCAHTEDPRVWAF